MRPYTINYIEIVYYILNMKVVFLFNFKLHLYIYIINK